MVRARSSSRSSSYGKDKERLDWMESHYLTHTMPVTAGTLAQCKHHPNQCPNPEEHGIWTIFGIEEGEFNGSTMRSAIDAVLAAEAEKGKP